MYLRWSCLYCRGPVKMPVRPPACRLGCRLRTYLPIPLGVALRGRAGSVGCKGGGPLRGVRVCRRQGRMPRDLRQAVVLLRAPSGSRARPPGLCPAAAATPGLPARERGQAPGSARDDQRADQVRPGLPGRGRTGRPAVPRAHLPGRRAGGQGRLPGPVVPLPVPARILARVQATRDIIADCERQLRAPGSGMPGMLSAAAGVRQVLGAVAAGYELSPGGRNSGVPDHRRPATSASAARGRSPLAWPRRHRPRRVAAPDRGRPCSRSCRRAAASSPAGAAAPRALWHPPASTRARKRRPRRSGLGDRDGTAGSAAAAGETGRRAASRGRGHRVARYRRVASPYRAGGTPTRGICRKAGEQPLRLARPPDGRRPAARRYRLLRPREETAS